MPRYWIFLVSLLAADIAHADAWSTYVNERYGLRLSYPAEIFTLERESDGGDGALFKTHDTDAKLLIGILPNVDRHNPRTYQDLIAHKAYGAFEIDYQKRGNTWLALSGENDSTEFTYRTPSCCSA